MHEPYSRVLAMPWVEVMAVLIVARELRAEDTADAFTAFRQLLSREA